MDKTTTGARAILTAGAVMLIAGCGGGGDDAPAPTGSPTGSTTLSADQQAFESLAVLPATGAYGLHWFLQDTGAQSSGDNFAYSVYNLLSASPFTQGPQRAKSSVPRNLSTKLALVVGFPARVLKNGVVLVVPDGQEETITSYVGTGVQVDTLSADGSVAFSNRYDGFATVPLSGALTAAPDALTRWHNSLWSNTTNFKPDAAFAVGAAYTTFTATTVGDRYNVTDCTSLTSGAFPSPCVTNITLAAALASTTGIVNADAGITYRTANGTFSTVGGLPVWVATAPLPMSATLSSTVQYRYFYQLRGNVYTGTLMKSGAVLDGSYWVSNPGAATPADQITVLPYQVWLNKAAHDSIAAAVAF